MDRKGKCRSKPNFQDCKNASLFGRCSSHFPFEMRMVPVDNRKEVAVAMFRLFKVPPGHPIQFLESVHSSLSTPSSSSFIPFMMRITVDSSPTSKPCSSTAHHSNHTSPSPRTHKPCKEAYPHRSPSNTHPVLPFSPAPDPS